MCLGILWAAPALRASPIYLSYTGGTVHFFVPADVFSLQVELWGGGGGSAGGSSGYVTALLSVTPNEDLTVNVAGSGRAIFSEAAVMGGFGGGGIGNGADFNNGGGWGGSGGGATSILLGSTLLLDAAGGGGGGAGSGGAVGGGGGLIGSDGIGQPGGGGGTQTAGGVNTGYPTWPCQNCNGSLGLGGTGDIWEGGGGGGGGYYGGAGGAAGLGAFVGWNPRRWRRRLFIYRRSRCFERQHLVWQRWDQQRSTTREHQRSKLSVWDRKRWRLCRSWGKWLGRAELYSGPRTVDLGDDIRCKPDIWCLQENDAALWRLGASCITSDVARLGA